MPRIAEYLHDGSTSVRCTCGGTSVRAWHGAKSCYSPWNYLENLRDLRAGETYTTECTNCHVVHEQVAGQRVVGDE